MAAIDYSLGLHAAVGDRYGEGPLVLYMDGCGEGSHTMTAHLLSLKTGKSVKEIKSPIPDSLGRLDLISPVDDESTLVAIENCQKIAIVDVGKPVASWASPLLRLPWNIGGMALKVGMVRNDFALGMAGYRPGHVLYAAQGMKKWVRLFTRSLQCTDFLTCKKDDCFYLLDARSEKVTSVQFPFKFPLFLTPADFNDTYLKVQDLTFDLVPTNDLSPDHNEKWSPCWDGRLVRSPTALFLVRWRWRASPQHVQQPKKQFFVFKLDMEGGCKNKWDMVNSLDNCAFFLGPGNSMALSRLNFPHLAPDLIYFLSDRDIHERDIFSVYDLKQGTLSYLDGVSTRNFQLHWIIPQKPQREKRRYEESEDISIPGEAKGNWRRGRTTSINENKDLE